MRNRLHRKLRKEWCDATGKFKYLTREEGAAGMFLLASSEGETNLSVYRCTSCQEFHVGHTPRRIVERFGLGHDAKPAQEDHGQ